MRKGDFNPSVNFPKGQNGGGRKPIPIELWKDGEFVKSFPNMKEAAEWLGIKQNTLSLIFARGQRAKRMYEVRRGETIDEMMERIERENKQPYQFSRKGGTP